MRAVLAFVAMMASACGFTAGGVSGTSDGGGSGSAVHDGGVDDADGAISLPDANLIATNCPWDYAPKYATPCPGLPGTDVEFSAGVWSLDTQAGTLLAPSAATPQQLVTEISNGQMRVWVHHLHIATGAILRITGPNPVTFISTTDITIDGTVVASGSTDVDGNAIVGPGGNNQLLCTPGDTNGAFNGAPCADQGASGGGGGGFGGGNGGNGGGGGTGHSCGAAGNGPIPGANGGVSLGAIPEALRGGCSGGNGGKSSQMAGGNGGIGGAAGGGVAFIARGDTSIIGRIVAGGGGGGGGNMSRSGGGGGGSGGMIVVEGLTVHLTSTGIIAADGGGGGGGCDMNSAMAGQDGPASSASALGGTKEGAGTDGARGGGLGNVAESANISGRGGGGGGGAIGWIWLRGATQTVNQGTVAPSPKP